MRFDISQQLLRRLLLWPLLSALLVQHATLAASAEHVKIGVLRIVSAGPVFIAQDRGYFAVEGLDAEPVIFDNAVPMALATTAGDIDFGVSALSGALYSLAGHDALRIIAASAREAPGFQATAYVVSNRAFATGLKSLKDFPGHSVSVPVFGSPPHYSMALLAEKYGFPLQSVHLVALQSIANQVSAVIGGTSDAGLIQATAVMPAIAQHEAVLLGFVGDETPFQLSAAYTATKTADERRSTVEKFLRAYRKGTAAYHAAFIDAQGQRKDGPTAPEILAILSRHIGQSAEQIGRAVSYIDAEARLDAADVLHQIAWYRAQNLLKQPVDAEHLIDKRYVVPLPPSEHHVREGRASTG